MEEVNMRNMMMRLSILFCGVTIGLSSGWAETASPVMERSSAFVNLRGMGLPAAVWGGGLLVTGVAEPDSGPTPNLFVYERSGREVAALALRVPAAKSRLYRPAVSATGAIGAMCTAVDQQGQTGGFLALLANARATPVFVKLHPFVAQTISFAPDGSLWVLVTPSGLLPDVEKPADYDILWQFDSSGRLLRKMVRLSSLGLAGGEPGVHHRYAFRQYLGVSRDRVSLFVPALKSLIEWDLDGVKRASYALSTPAGWSATQFVNMIVSPDGIVAASMSATAATARQVHILDRGRGQWIPLRQGGEETAGADTELALGFDSDGRIVTATLGDNAVVFSPAGNSLP